MRKRGKRAAVICGIALVLLAIGYFAIARTIDHFLKNGGLDRAIGKKTAVILKADTGYLPLFWRGLSVHSNGILVQGKAPRSLKKMCAANLKASCSLQELWQRKWLINRLQAERLEVAFGAAAEKQLANILPAEPELQPQVDTPSPLKLVIRETVIDRTDIFWGETDESVGALRDVESKFYPAGSDLDAIGNGGTFHQTGWPELHVARIQAHYAKPKLEVRSAGFALGKSEDISVNGDFDFGQNGGMRLHTRSAQAPAEPFLKGFWKGKFEGTFDGDAQIEKKFEKDTKVNAAGALTFVRAEIHDVPTLNRIATLTHHPQFEHLKLNELRGRYKWDGSKLEVTDLRIEEKNLFRIDGNFVIESENIEGKFRVGATEDVLGTIPGAREKVFTESHDGYRWTSMNVRGPMQHPREDLHDRLVTAAQEQFTKGFLAPIFKPGKVVLEMLKALYPE
jgi:hypothetical protein